MAEIKTDSLQGIWHQHSSLFPCTDWAGSTLPPTIPEALFAMFQNSLVITLFVLQIMLFVEFWNLRPNSNLLNRLRQNLNPYFLGALLGSVPGCFGCFAAVALYSHGIISFGVLAAAALATTGDEIFVIFASNQGLALLLTMSLIMLAIPLGRFLDRHQKKEDLFQACDGLRVHHHHEEGGQIDLRQIIRNLSRPGLTRMVLIVIQIVFFVGLIFDRLGHSHNSLALKIALCLVFIGGLLIILSANEHFLQDHFLHHIVKSHGPKIFGWTFLAYILIYLAFDSKYLQDFVKSQPLFMMFMAALVGLIPESGPHLFFFYLFQSEQTSFLTLLVNSMVQSGHGLLPLLSHSFREFVRLKLALLVYALLIGYSLHFLWYSLYHALMRGMGL